jgi:hypothetical protein
MPELHAWMAKMDVPISVRDAHFNPDSMFVETKHKPFWIK